MDKAISKRQLELSVSLLDKYDQQLKLVDEMRTATCARRDTMMEFIRANYTGDAKAFETLRKGFIGSDGRGNTMRYYDKGLLDTMRTKQIVERARKEVAGDTCEDEGCPHYGTPHGHTGDAP